MVGTHYITTGKLFYQLLLGLFHENKLNPFSSNVLLGLCSHLYRSLQPRTAAMFNSLDWCFQELEAHKNLTRLSYKHILWIVRHSRNTNESV